jgi:hypothetical protein
MVMTSMPCIKKMRAIKSEYKAKITCEYEIQRGREGRG